MYAAFDLRKVLYVVLLHSSGGNTYLSGRPVALGLSLKNQCVNPMPQISMTKS